MIPRRLSADPTGTAAEEEVLARPKWYDNHCYFAACHAVSAGSCHFTANIGVITLFLSLKYAPQYVNFVLMVKINCQMPAHGICIERYPGCNLMAETKGGAIIYYSDVLPP